MKYKLNFDIEFPLYSFRAGEIFTKDEWLVKLNLTSEQFDNATYKWFQEIDEPKKLSLTIGNSVYGVEKNTIIYWINESYPNNLTVCTKLSQNIDDEWLASKKLSTEKLFLNEDDAHEFIFKNVKRFSLKDLETRSLDAMIRTVYMYN
jgi:DNA-binding XRE family transcriptional regulator